MKLHERIKQYMNDNKIRINEVGDKTDIEIKRFYRIIAGDSKMTADEFEHICEVMDIDPSYFFKSNFLETKTDDKVS